MSRAFLRSALELRTPLARLPPTFLLPLRARLFNSTAHIVEPPQLDRTIPPVPNAGGSEHTKTASIQSSLRQRSAAPPGAAPSAGPLPESVRNLLPILASQPGQYVTIHVHGRPYLVTPGDSIRLPFKMPGVLPGDVLRLNRASVLGSRDFTLKGAPFIDERLYECRAVVLGTESEPMRLMIKKKRRNRRKKTVRSKHKYTVLRVSELKVNGPDEVQV
ncbi:Aconitate hydratase [Pleurostoma richardsiae]|uniref:Large ribosomal subunit protein bL21m n=1 Tax=Pleurostoma richardsiae TaxID=41990 RepID=A0AA38VNW2_9PEZI|nr:Aconitate hydratase [Pleurostoma richardsiae]